MKRIIIVLCLTSVSFTMTALAGVPEPVRIETRPMEPNSPFYPIVIEDFGAC